MSQAKVIVDSERFQLIIDRLCYQLIEDYDTFANTCLIGIQPKGSMLSDRLKARLSDILGHQRFLYGKLDITFYRDDFRRMGKILNPSPMEIDFSVEEKDVILCDDVLYTGRTARAALTALDHLGRPNTVHFVSMVDRRFNRQLPIRSDYTGMRVDALDEAYVKVEWAHQDGKDQILLFSDKKGVN